MVVSELPRKQTRVLTWPIATVFGFLAIPDRHIFLKPTVTKIAAREYGCDFHLRIASSVEDLRQSPGVREPSSR